MIRGTTPTFVIHITGDTLNDATPYVTLKQGQTEVTRSGAELIVEQDEKSCTVSITLTQEESLKFSRGNAEIQIRWVNADGQAGGQRLSRPYP